MPNQKQKAKTRKIKQKGNHCVHGNNVDNRKNLKIKNQNHFI